MGPPGHILWNIKWPFLAVALEVLIICVWQNYYEEIFPDWKIMDKDKVLQTNFRLSSFAMSLLLAFRINRTYGRLMIENASNIITTLTVAIYCKSHAALVEFRSALRDTHDR